MTTLPESTADVLPNDAAELASDDVVPAESPTFQMLLASKRKRQAATRRKIFSIPGYDGMLGAKIQCADAHGLMLDASAGLEDAEITKENIDEVLRARCSLIARATIEIYARDDEMRPWRPLREREGGPATPIRFDERLVRYLDGTPEELPHPEGLEAGTADAVRWVIGEGNDTNLAGWFMDLVMWFAKETPDADDELVGESSAPN